MLEFLEDIVGSSRYKEPIEKLHQRVQDMDELRTEKLNRVKLVEKEKLELEKPKNEAMDYLHLANDIVHKQVHTKEVTFVYPLKKLPLYTYLIE